MKKLLTVILLVPIFSAFAQTDQELIKTAIEFEDVKEFLSENIEGEIFLKQVDFFVSLEDGDRKTSLAPNEAKLILESVIDEGEKYKLKFHINEYVFGKVTILKENRELKIKRASLKAGEGKNKVKMVSFEF